LIDNFDTFDNVGESRKLTSELWLVCDDEKELGTGAIGISRQQRCRDGALCEWNFAELRFQSHVESTGSILCSCLRILGFRITALNNSVRNRAVKDRPFVESMFCQVDEFPDVIRRLIGIKLDDERACGGIKHRLKLFQIFLREQQQCGKEQCS